MDIEKTKAEFEKSECFKRFKDVVQHTFFDFGTYCIRTDVPRDVEKKIEKLVSGLIFSWKAWKEAKAQAVPEGFVLVKDEPVAYMVQNKFWKGEFEVKLLSEMPELEFDGDSYDVEIPLYMIEAQEPTND